MKSAATGCAYALSGAGSAIRCNYPTPRDPGPGTSLCFRSVSEARQVDDKLSTGEMNVLGCRFPVPVSEVYPTLGCARKCNSQLQMVVSRHQNNVKAFHARRADGTRR